MSAESLTHVATYQRTVKAPLVRVWENVFDWEHLPWLHRSAFFAIEHVDSGRWGWKARIALQPEESRQEILLELVVDRPARRYVARTLEGGGKGTEIWTDLDPIDDLQTGIEVEFHLPGVAPGQEDALGAAFTRVYTRLWDEDEAMMIRRGERLARRADPGEPPKPVSLGRLDDLRSRLPLVLEAGGHPFRIIELQGELVAHSTVCAHMLGPLDHASLEEGRIRCPWHGYRFDVRTGRCLDSTRLRLHPAPRVEIDPASSEVRLLWGS